MTHTEIFFLQVSVFNQVSTFLLSAMINNCKRHCDIHKWFKASYFFHKLIPQNTQMTTLYTNLLLYGTFTMIYYIRQELFLLSYGNQAMIKSAHCWSLSCDLHG